MALITEIAEWIVKYRADNGAPIDRVSLQKMLFYTQAFRLARHGEPLFQDRFEAWVNGPVAPAVWHHYGKNNGRFIDPDENRPQPQFDAETGGELRDIVDFFSAFNAFTLSRATHEEEPWREARDNLPDDQPTAETIPTERIRSYYAALIADGEEALSRHEVLDQVPEPRIPEFYRAGICVRRMTRHPFYRMQLADALLESVDADEELPDELYAPIKNHALLTASEL